MANTPEARVKSRVKNMLNDFDVYWFMPATGGYGGSGALDICGCLKGRFVAIECKADASCKPTALQRAHADKIFSAGGLALLIHASNMQVLEHCLSRITDDACVEFDRESLWPIACFTVGRRNA
jgi:hypothetical protein